MLHISINDPKTTAKALKALVKFASTEKTNPKYSVIDFATHGDHLIATAVDGYRLATLDIPIGNDGIDVNFSIDSNVFKSVKSIMHISVADATAVITLDGLDTSIRLSEPMGMTWDKVITQEIPDSATNGLVLNAKYITDACALISSVDTQGKHRAKFEAMGGLESPMMITSVCTEIKARALVLPILYRED